jgi:electron transfer flavoprotein beta subunit
MKIVVAIQLVPDLVEELVVDLDGSHLDPSTVRWVINEYDDYAIEQAILLKERTGGQVCVIAPDIEGADDALYSAAAKGADELVKLYGDFEAETNNHALARLFVPLIQRLQPGLILTGVQAHHRWDGGLGPIMAAMLDIPYIGYISKVTLAEAKVVVNKEYSGGMIAEMESPLPVVLGIQAPDTPPRYVPISKIRQVMKTSKIREEEAGDFDLTGGLSIQEMYIPEAASRATIFEGNVEEVAAQLVSVFKDEGIL